MSISWQYSRKHHATTHLIFKKKAFLHTCLCEARYRLHAARTVRAYSQVLRVRSALRSSKTWKCFSQSGDPAWPQLRGTYPYLNHDTLVTRAMVGRPTYLEHLVSTLLHMYNSTLGITPNNRNTNEHLPHSCTTPGQILQLTNSCLFIELVYSKVVGPFYSKGYALRGFVSRMWRILEVRTLRMETSKTKTSSIRHILDMDAA